MATVSPSPDSTPVSPSPPPVSTSPPPVSTSPPPLSSTTPPPPQTSPPIPQTTANPPDTSIPSPPNAPPPSNSGPPTATPPPNANAPPPNANAPPPSVPVTPPPAAPPPVPSASPPPPPTANPPVASPPPAVVPPPSQPATPPASSPPPPVNPPSSSPPPPEPSTPPPTSSPSPPTSTPTPPSANPPDNPPPPSQPSPNPPEGSPTPPASSPPEIPPPSPPSSQPPRSSPTPPAASPPRRSPPPSRDSQPPSVPDPTSPPSTPGFRSPPPPGLVPSSPTVPGTRSSPDAPQTANNAPGNGGIGMGGTIAIGVVVGLLILGFIALVGLWIFKRKRKSSGPYDGHVIPASIGSSPRSDGKLLVTTEYPGSNFGGSGSDTPTDHGGFGHSRSWFTYNELYDATSGFSDEKLLGEGGFGRVHKGLLSDGRVVAVKQLKVGGGQGEREFKAEVEIISRIHHRHLVSLVGYCILESKRLLVYEYVPNNTLHYHLHGEGRLVLDWATRVKIAVGAARGIAYLHEDCHPRIIHRDIKSTNILLDNNFESRVADFGLAKLAMDAETHVSTRVMGTFGYMAPEYATSGKLTEKSDVYSYGVVLLELITGRKPVDESQPLGDESLVEWARPLLAHALETGELEGLVDQRLEKNYIESEVFRMIEAAAACVRHSSTKRPRMGLVLRALSMSDSGDLSNGLRVGESQLYDSAQQSAEIKWFRRMAFGGSQDISSGDFYNDSSQNLGFSGQNRRNDLSTQHNRNVGFSGQSRRNDLSTQHDYDRNVGFSGQSRQNDLSTQHDLDRNVGFSGQSRQNNLSNNLSTQHEHNRNVWFSGQSRQTADLSTLHEQNRNSQNVGIPNQIGNFPVNHPSNQHNQGNRNLSFSQGR